MDNDNKDKESEQNSDTWKSMYFDLDKQVKKYEELTDRAIDVSRKSLDLFDKTYSKAKWYVIIYSIVWFLIGVLLTLRAVTY